MEASNAMRRLGLPLAVVSSFGVASDGLLVKLGIRDGLSDAAVVIWKYVAASVAMAAILCALWAVDRLGWSGSEPFITWPSPLGRRYIAVASVVMVCIEICYTLGFAFTTSANVLAFSSLAPLWSALFSRLLLNSRAPMRTLVAAVVALAGSIVVAVGVGLGSEEGRTAGEPLSRRVLGTLLAVGTGFFLGIFVVLIEMAAVRTPEAQMLYANLAGFVTTAGAGFALAPALQPAGAPLAPSAAAVGWLLINGTLCTGLSITGFTLAGRLIPATEVSLIVQLEGLLGPLSTFIVLGEVPTMYTVAGGIIVVVTVAVHEALAFREDTLAHAHGGARGSDGEPESGAFAGLTPALSVNGAPSTAGPQAAGREK